MRAAKPKLRMAPTLEDLAVQQDVAENLIKLNDWTEKPISDLALAPAAVKPLPKAKPTPKAPVVIEPPARRQWESATPDAAHPYYIILTEGEFQKLDFAWKRMGLKSLKALVRMTLVERANAILKELGEQP